MKSPHGITGRWSKTESGHWKLSLGYWGTTVRIFEHRNGVYYRDVTLGGKKHRLSLKTRSKEVAATLGKKLLAAMQSGQDAGPRSPLTLGELWTRFASENHAWLDNAETSKRDDRHSAKMLLAYFGENRSVVSLTEYEQTGFWNARCNGTIQLADGTTAKPVRPRSCQADLHLLHAMLRWASRTRDKFGVPLIPHHPLAGVKVDKERNGIRPIATIERFNSTREAIKQQIANAEKERTKRLWMKIEMALVLAEATGRRLGSIQHLRWEDVDFQHGMLHWRKEHDKKGREYRIPIPASLLGELRTYRLESSAITGWLFPSESDSSKPMDRHLFDKWLRVAEAAAGLTKLDGGLWHPYRRKWATERKGNALADVMAAGGWTDAATLLRSYQQADIESLMKVMSEPAKLTDAALNG